MSKSLKNITPRLLVWGLSFVLISMVVFVSCGSTLSTWSNDGFEASYDSSVFTVDSSDSQILELSSETEDGLVRVQITGFHPFAVESDLTEYLSSAQVSFEEEFSRITNNKKEDNVQYGITDRRVSISGRMDGFDGAVMGMMRVMLSGDTLLHIKIYGDSKAMMAQMSYVQAMLGDSKIVE